MNKSAIPTSAQAELREDAMRRAGEFLNMRLILLVEEAGSNWGALLQAQEATAALKHDRTPDVGGVLGEIYRERERLPGILPEHNPWPQSEVVAQVWWCCVFLLGEGSGAMRESLFDHLAFCGQPWTCALVDNSLRAPLLTLFYPLEDGCHL